MCVFIAINLGCCIGVLVAYTEISICETKPAVSGLLKDLEERKSGQNEC